MDFSITHQIIQDISIAIAILIGLKKLLPISQYQQQIALLQADLSSLKEQFRSHQQDDKEGLKELSHKMDNIQEYLLTHDR